MILSVFSSLLPVVLMILLGTALRQFRFLPADALQGLNKLAFWVGLPCMLFFEISKIDAVPQGVAKISLAIMMAAFGTAFIGLLLALLLRLPLPTMRSFIQGAFRCNTAYVGIPVIYYALSDYPEMRAIAILALAPTIPFYNIGGVLILVDPGRGNRGDRIKRIIYEIARNPLIISCLLGILFLRCGWKLPLALSRTIEGMGRMGLPAALMALGASLSLKSLKGAVGWLALASAFIKAVVSPLLGYCGGLMLGLSGHNLLIATIYTATPTAVASYVMAEQMGADKELAAAIIVISTLLAFPTLLVVLALLQ